MGFYEGTVKRAQPARFSRAGLVKQFLHGGSLSKIVGTASETLTRMPRSRPLENSQPKVNVSTIKASSRGRMINLRPLLGCNS